MTIGKKRVAGTATATHPSKCAAVAGYHALRPVYSPSKLSTPANG